MSNKVCGKVLLKETGVGIPDLLIEIYDVDPKTEPEIIVQFTQNNPDFAASSPDFWQNFSGDRLGSVPTNESGKFELIYEDSDFQRSEEEGKRPDLMVLVIAPEQMKDAPCPQILHISCGIRQNAGRVENYIIKLTKKQLEKADIELAQLITQEPEKPEVIIQKLTQTIERQEQISSGLREIATQKINQQREQNKQLEANTAQILESLSSVPVSVRKSLNYVGLGESVEEVNNRVIEADLVNNINNSDNRAPIRGHIRLTEKLKQILEQYKNANGDYVDVPGEFVEPYIFGRSETTIANVGNEATLIAPIPDDEIEARERSSYFIQEDPIEKFCREKIQEEINARICLGLSENDPDSPEPESDDNPDDEPINILGNGVRLSDNGTSWSYVAEHLEKLMKSVASPEEPVIFGEIGKSTKLYRAEQGNIEENIAKFSIKSSPADTTAYYDFHNLQIAFDHVWQEYFDQDLVNDLSSLQKQILDNGGSVNEAINSANPLQALMNEAENSQNLGNQIQNLSIPLLDDEEEDICQERCRLERITCLMRCRIGTIEGGTRNPPSGGGFPVDPQRGGSSSNNLIAQLKQRLKENYAFKAFGAGGQERSINYGILVTYRQKWQPINYQVGELVKTIPLAPQEVRKFSKKMTVKTKIAQKEVEKNSTSRREESDTTSRAEDEILRKATSDNSFDLVANGTFKLPIIGEGSQTTTIGRDAGKISEEVKKAFREAVIKAANEYKQERTLEITTEEFEEFEETESGEISNPNDELSVTFMFYELQRRYRVSEKIHRLTPVVLVAQEIPNPKDIDEDWLIAHDWILKRVILDDSFLPALFYLSTRFSGDLIALNQLSQNVAEYRKLVRDLRSDVVALEGQTNRSYMALQRTIEEEAGIVGGEGGLREDAERIGTAIATGGLSEVGRFFGFGGGGSDDEDEIEAAKIRQQAARDAYERLTNEEKLLRSRLDRAVTALNAATETYTKALREHENYKIQILRLRLHIKQNIIYYMQAIWSYEEPDQRFMRLSQTKVPIIKGTKKYNIKREPEQTLSSNLSQLTLSGSWKGRFPFPSYETEVDPDIKVERNPGNKEPIPSTTLVEVADLDNLLGFKGNYMIFPLKKSNLVTDLMMEPYIDEGFTKLIDPDEIGNWTLEEFSKFICCLKKKLSPEEFDSKKEALKQQYEAILTSPRRTYEDIIVPTGSLFIEALPGKHPLLEDFKLMHRAIDVKKVQAEVRAEELENLRMAARLLAEDYDDPDIEKKIVIEGNGQSVIVPVENE